MNLITNYLSNQGWEWKIVDSDTSKYLGISKLVEGLGISLEGSNTSWWDYIIGKGGEEVYSSKKVVVKPLSIEFIPFLDKVLEEADRVTNEAIINYLKQEIPGEWKRYPTCYSWGMDGLCLECDGTWDLYKPTTIAGKQPSLSLEYKVGSKEFKEFLGRRGEL